MNFKIDYKVKNSYASPALKNVTLDGEIGIRFDRFIHERVSGKFAVDEILKEAEKCFYDQLDDEFNYGVWRSEFWGKLVLSAVRVAKMKGDSELSSAIKRSVYKMLSYQREDGYLSAYRNSEHIFPVDTKISIEQVGWACDYSWNVWGQKYTLWALLEAAILLDDGNILSACVKLADRLISQIEGYGKKVRETGVMHGLASSSIMKPMLLLYRLTADKKYLDFAIGIAEEFDREDGACPNIIRNALSGKAVANWYKLEDGWYAKAYEMMSCFDGLVELYRVTGNEKYRRATEAFFDIVNENEVNILGSAGYCERFAEAKKYPDSATEVCDAIHWMRISYELFSLSGEEKYVSAFENAFLNAFLAGVNIDGRGGAFFVRSAGRHYTAEVQVGTKYQNCCLNNVPRGFVNAAEIVASKTDAGYSINSYVPATVRFADTLIHIGAGYLDKGNFFITVRGASVGEVLRMRIPSWTSRAVIKIGSEERVFTESGKYIEITLGSVDTLIQVTFDMEAKVIDFEGEYTDLPATDYHRRRWCDSMEGLCDRGAMVYHPMSHIRRGPLLLARTKKLGAKEEDMFSGETVCKKNASCESTVIRHDRLLTACRVKLTTEEKEYNYVMCDFASSANFDLDEARYFTVFV